MDQTNTAYSVNQTYTGPRNISVPTRMYSKNKMLSALHMKSKRVLCVNMDMALLTFHPDKDSADRDVKDEVPFSRIKSIDADVTSASKGKYYLTVITDECDLKFKFKDAKDFHSVVDALRNCLHNDKPVYTASSGYNSLSQNYATNPTAYDTHRGDDHDISSDDAHDYAYHNKERDMVKNTRQAQTNAAEDVHHVNKELIKDDYKGNRDNINTYADNSKDALKDDYKADKRSLDNQYDAQKDYMKNTGATSAQKDALKDDYKAEKKNLDHQYDAQKDYIKGSEKIAHDANKANYEATKDGINQQYDATKNNIDARY